MRKEAKILLIIVLIISLGLAYTVVFSSLDKSMTGKVVFNETVNPAPNEYNLNYGQKIVVNGKVVTLKDVGSTGTVIVDVDGATKLVKYQDTVSDLQITALKTYYDVSNVNNRAAKLKIVTSATAVNEVKCIDSDNGANYYIKGEVVEINQATQWKQKINSDTCMDGTTLIEMTCEQRVDGNFLVQKTRACPNGCADGKCVARVIDLGPNEYFFNYRQPQTIYGKTVTLSNVGSAGEAVINVNKDSRIISTLNTEVLNELSITVLVTSYDQYEANNRNAILKIVSTTKLSNLETSCRDSDSGRDYDVKGVVDVLEGTEISNSFEDSCDITTGLLKEHYCQNNEARTIIGYACPNGCKDGVCIQEVIAPETETPRALTIFQKIANWFKSIFS